MTTRREVCEMLRAVLFAMRDAKYAGVHSRVLAGLEAVTTIEATPPSANEIQDGPGASGAERPVASTYTDAPVSSAERTSAKSDDRPTNAVSGRPSRDARFEIGNAGTGADVRPDDAGSVPSPSIEAALVEFASADKVWLDDCRHTGKPGYNYTCDHQFAMVDAARRVAAACRAAQPSRDGNRLAEAERLLREMPDNCPLLVWQKWNAQRLAFLAGTTPPPPAPDEGELRDAVAEMDEAIRGMARVLDAGAPSVHTAHDAIESWGKLKAAYDRAARDGAVPKINYREYLETFSREWNDRASQGRSAALLQEARRVLGYFVNRAVEGEDGKRWRADDADYSYVTTHGVVRAAGAVYDAIGAFLLSHADQTQEGGK